MRRFPPGRKRTPPGWERTRPGWERGKKPTVRQIYAVARELCERAGEEFPENRKAASELIERLRIENGKPAIHIAKR